MKQHFAAFVLALVLLSAGCIDRRAAEPPAPVAETVSAPQAEPAPPPEPAKPARDTSYLLGLDWKQESPEELGLVRMAENENPALLLARNEIEMAGQSARGAKYQLFERRYDPISSTNIWKPVKPHEYILWTTQDNQRERQRFCVPSHGEVDNRIWWVMCKAAYELQAEGDGVNAEFLWKKAELAERLVRGLQVDETDAESLMFLASQREFVRGGEDTRWRGYHYLGEEYEKIFTDFPESEYADDAMFLHASRGILTGCVAELDCAFDATTVEFLKFIEQFPFSEYRGRAEAKVVDAVESILQRFYSPDSNNSRSDFDQDRFIEYLKRYEAAAKKFPPTFRRESLVRVLDWWNRAERPGLASILGEFLSKGFGDADEWATMLDGAEVHMASAGLVGVWRDETSEWMLARNGWGEKPEPWRKQFTYSLFQRLVDGGWKEVDPTDFIHAQTKNLFELCSEYAGTIPKPISLILCKDALEVARERNEVTPELLQLVAELFGGGAGLQYARDEHWNPEMGTNEIMAWMATRPEYKKYMYDGGFRYSGSDWHELARKFPESELADDAMFNYIETQTGDCHCSDAGPACPIYCFAHPYFEFLRLFPASSLRLDAEKIVDEQFNMLSSPSGQPGTLEFFEYYYDGHALAKLLNEYEPIVKNYPEPAKSEALAKIATWRARMAEVDAKVEAWRKQQESEPTP